MKYFQYVIIISTLTVIGYGCFWMEDHEDVNCNSNMSLTICNTSSSNILISYRLPLRLLYGDSVPYVDPGEITYPLDTSLIIPGSCITDTIHYIWQSLDYCFCPGLAYYYNIILDISRDKVADSSIILMLCKPYQGLHWNAEEIFHFRNDTIIIR